MSRVNAALIRRWFDVAWRPDRWALVGILLASIVNAALYVAFPWLWQYVVEATRDSSSPATLTELGIWIAVVGLAQSAFYVLLQGARTVMNARIQFRVRERVFHHLTTLSERFHDRWRLGDLITRLSDDAGDKTAWFLCSGIMRSWESLLILIASLTMMMWIDPWMSLVIVAPLPLLIIGQAAAQSTLERRFRAVQSSISRINESITDTFSGIRVIQAARLEPSARRRFSTLIEDQRHAEVRASIIQEAVMIMYGHGWQLAIVTLLLMGGARVLNGTLTLGQYITFEGLLMGLVWPMFDFGMFLSKYKQTGVALERIEELTSAHEPLRDTDRDLSSIPAEAPLIARGLGVEVEVVEADGDPSKKPSLGGEKKTETRKLLADVDLTLHPGDLLAIVGAVGSGKTVLIEALAGLRASSGARRLGDAPIPRSALALAPQDPVLLSMSVRDNILLGREVSDDTLSLALETSRFAQDLEQLPAGLDTEVGERGVTLSGGQQQRVALARALVGEPRILLLDDATAALDADTEAAFWRELERVLPNTCAVVVTHRLATIERADEVLVIEDGRVVQRGHHTALLDVPGPYARIYGRMRAMDTLSRAD